MLRPTSVLVNALGIRDSGAVTVLKRALSDFSKCKNYNYIIVCHSGKNVSLLQNENHKHHHLQFIFINNNSFWYRLFYENFKFMKIIKFRKVVLVYNLSGTLQFSHKIPQLIKVHNLLFFSTVLNQYYLEKKLFLSWLMQVFLKRQVLKLMMKYSKFIEIQSRHVKNELENFIFIKNKSFFVKSDISVSEGAFRDPKNFCSSNKIKFLFIVGPHFKYPHKNMTDFTESMVSLINRGIDFEIIITLTKYQLSSSGLWNDSLNSRTRFVGYLNNEEAMEKLFCDDTIIVSTSIIETLGLHVIEGIKNGIIPITPDENYAYSVYGEQVLKYKLFERNALTNCIMNVLDNKGSFTEHVLSIQNDLRVSESGKFSNILDVFNEVLNVQK